MIHGVVFSNLEGTGNIIGIEGTIAIGEALKVNTALIALDLESN